MLYAAWCISVSVVYRDIHNMKTERTQGLLLRARRSRAHVRHQRQRYSELTRNAIVALACLFIGSPFTVRAADPDGAVINVSPVWAAMTVGGSIEITGLLTIHAPSLSNLTDGQQIADYRLTSEMGKIAVKWDSLKVTQSPADRARASLRHVGGSGVINVRLIPDAGNWEDDGWLVCPSSPCSGQIVVADSQQVVPGDYVVALTYANYY